MTATDNRNAICKELYNRTFNWLVQKINKAVQRDHGSGGSSKESIMVVGILDIFGFEIFESNSFEQLCINFANERYEMFVAGAATLNVLNQPHFVLCLSLFAGCNNISIPPHSKKKRRSTKMKALITKKLCLLTTKMSLHWSATKVASFINWTKKLKYHVVPPKVFTINWSKILPGAQNNT